MASKPYEVKWGILATGGIATTFCKDILCNPSTRNVLDIQHTIVAAASSSSASRAETFLKEINARPGTKAYGSYHELVNDPNIDVIYIATPHSHHFQNAIEREKPLLHGSSMDEVLPPEHPDQGTGKQQSHREVHRVFADLSIAEATEDGSLAFRPENRMVNPDLAGGALLDLGIYSLTHEGGNPSFWPGVPTVAVYRVFQNAHEAGAFETVDCPIPADPERGNWGHGMAWEADEGGEMLRDGKKESAALDWRESEVIMGVMDEVRSQGGLKYSEEIESDVFDAKSGLNGRA
ncbi:hypothetical protein EYC84_005155 [Monilinia fructicola]|uniref:D-xylose 1-dehydrogenase (NADP(+), D-xylono-1,5-lactone-forming) n=1 Tax=Monilinia fructicola TaxID=38448 RepID=A0A5M9K0R6_MONFR|nr:hypothetical protein EYC84_005155 [Monilinia fructicola]